MTAPTPVHPALAGLVALAENWRYKGEFGWGPWQEGHGPDPEGYVLDGAAAELRAAIAEASERLGEAREEWGIQLGADAIARVDMKPEVAADYIRHGVEVYRREVYRTPWRPAGGQSDADGGEGE